MFQYQTKSKQHGLHIQQHLLEIEIPRCYFQEGNASDTQLHVFIDESQLVYGACKYLVAKTKSTLAVTRNRVALLKRIMLPKLVLLEAVIEAKLANYLLENMNQKSREVHFCTDSQLV